MRPSSKPSTKSKPSEILFKNGPKSPLYPHVLQYQDCTLCPISKLTSTKVFYRGAYPSKILFVGEAPGETEDSIGLPFVGRSGEVLNQLIEECGISPQDYGITNTILCTPYEDRTRSGIRTPTKEEIHNCSPRLKSLIEDSPSPPKIIIAVGKQAQTSLVKLKIPFTPIVHPAFILRNGGPNSGQGRVHFHRSILIIKKAIEDAS